MLQRDADPGAVAGHRSGLPGAGADGRHAGGSWLSRLGREDRAALGIWGAAHLAFLVLAWAAAWAFRSSTAHAPLTGVFEHWDATLMREVAQYGYFGPHAVPNNDAFFPGYPVALRLAHLLLRNWVLAELAVPAVAGCFAVVALARLAHEPPRRAVPGRVARGDLPHGRVRRGPVPGVRCPGVARCQPRAAGGGQRSWPAWPAWSARRPVPDPGAGRDGPRPASTSARSRR